MLITAIAYNQLIYTKLHSKIVPVSLRRKEAISEDSNYHDRRQLAYFRCRVCDPAKRFERSNETCSIMDQPLIVTLA